jgi:hypothetical protein
VGHSAVVTGEDRRHPPLFQQYLQLVVKFHPNRVREVWTDVEATECLPMLCNLWVLSPLDPTNYSAGNYYRN